MKLKVLIISLLTLLFISLGIFSCEDDSLTYCNCRKNEYLRDVENLKGRIYYNSNIQKWIIDYAEPGTFDSGIVFIPCHLSKDYRKSEIGVVFSGKVFLPSVEIKYALPVGTEYRCIALSSIKIIK